MKNSLDSVNPLEEQRRLLTLSFHLAHPRSHDWLRKKLAAVESKLSGPLPPLRFTKEDMEKFAMLRSKMARVAFDVRHRN
jgi:hypothetical protein